MRRLLVIVLATLAQLCPAVSPAVAQSVAVRNGSERGHGWMFAHDGACYLITPRHVAEEGAQRMTIRTAAPVVSGVGYGRLPFWPGFDLAIATVSENLLPRCTGDLNALDLPVEVAQVQSALLEQMTGAGEIRRTPLTIGDRSYLEFIGTVPLGEHTAQGTSGAFAFAQGRPVGMAVTSVGDRTATFVRSEEIYINVSRWLEEHGSGFATPTEAAEPEEGVGSDWPIIWVRGAPEPIDPAHEGSNLTQRDGVFVTYPSSGSIEMLFRLGDGERAVQLSQVLIDAPVDTGFAIPRDVLVDFSAREDGLSMRGFFRGQMSPGGILRSPPLAARNARWMRVRILSAWDEGPVAIQQVRAR